MARRPITLFNLAIVLLIGLACVPLFLALMPNIEASRTEARLSMAYLEVRRLADASAAEPPTTTIDLPDRDPWGQPYRLIPLSGSKIRVLSSGPNESFRPDGTDADDIYSDMPASPTEAIFARKDRQSLVALGTAAAVWVLLASLYMRYRRSPSS